MNLFNVLHFQLGKNFTLYQESSTSRFLLILSFAVFALTNDSTAQNKIFLLDSTKTIILPDVEIRGYPEQIVLFSGVEHRNHGYYLGPGGGNALYYKKALVNHRNLSQIRLHLVNPKSIREGNLSIRIASVTATGDPAADNLLAEPIIISNERLRHSKKSFLLRLPAPGIAMPETGFFIVLECIGNSSTEYVSALAPGKSKSAAPVYIISANENPQAPTRQVPMHYFPALAGAKPTDASSIVEYYQDTVTKKWQRSKNSIIFLEASFK